MAPRTFPGIGLSGDWTLGEDGWKPGMDSNLLRLSVLVQTAVDSSVAAYPGSPSQGDIHRLTGTVDEDDIIVYDNGAWVNFPPFEGMRIWDIAAQSRLSYTVATGWTPSDEMSAADIKAAYESNPDTNAFTDAEKAKLTGVEAGATADQSASEIKTAYESNADTNAFTDAEKTKLAGLSDPLFKGIHVSAGALTTAHPAPEVGSYAYVDPGTGSDSELYIWDDDDSAWVLGGGAGGSSETPTTIKTKYESNADTNAFTDAEKTKLAGVATGATANASDADLRDRATHTGLLPSAGFDDTSHGNRSGGSLHTNATGSVAGFMSAADKTKLDDLSSVVTESLTIALSDLTSALTTGTAKETIRMPYAFTLTGVRAYLATSQASGSILTVDINEGGASILSTKLTIDNGEKTSTTAAAAAVISDTALADDAEITFDVDQVGSGGAGLKVVLIGHRT